MRKSSVASICLLFAVAVLLSFRSTPVSGYKEHYINRINDLAHREAGLLKVISAADLSDSNDLQKIRLLIDSSRLAMKAADLWLRYLEPLAYKKINGPLPVEWETEVFEKFEKPYKRENAGLTLAAQYLDEQEVSKDSLLSLVKQALAATQVYVADSITEDISSYHHLYLCNRLFLLNLAAIYTTGFECPNPERVIPELRYMLAEAQSSYSAFNAAFPATPLNADYLEHFAAMISFCAAQPDDNARFDHFTFLRDHVNPLFQQNQQHIERYHVISRSLIDYTLNKKAKSIFDKSLYNGQNTKGIFLRVTDSAALAEIEQTGRKLFYDPILSGNNMRSCASCHKPRQFFTDTSVATAAQFNGSAALPRNTPSLVNTPYNHLAMLDGKHISLQDQVLGVVTNADEMNCAAIDALEKVLSCKEYRRSFNRLLKYTPQENEVTFSHIASAITYYYSKFSNGYSPFDEAMNNKSELPSHAVAGFNLFMGKAQCATCHFVPQFNGVKPPYIGSEFEVLGVPADPRYASLSADAGRYAINPAKETKNAFRTGTVRNAMHTAPYMHNGVFKTIDEVIEFYDNGGGIGHGLQVDNQTLSADSLHLTNTEKKNLIAFISSLSEAIVFEAEPEHLPRSTNKKLNNRKPAGIY